MRALSGEPTIEELQAQIAIYDEKFRASEARVLALTKELGQRLVQLLAARYHEQEIARLNQQLKAETRRFEQALKDRDEVAAANLTAFDEDIDTLGSEIESLQPAWVLGFNAPIPNDPIRNLRLQ